MLSHRRRTLLTLASYGTWDFDLTSFPYVYNSLLAKGSEVVKGKIAKIYANGVIENQLNYYGDMSSVDGYYGIDTDISDTTLAVSNGVLTITPVSNLAKIRVVSRQNIQIIANHKYLISADIKSSIQLNSVGQRVGTSTIPNLGNVSANVWTKVSSILSSSVNDLNQSTWYFKSDTAIATTDSIQIKNAMCIDLTQMFGTGNEPTTLADNRIQNLLNRGYIAYNQGEYKGTNVSEIETTGANLFNQQLEQGGIYGANGEESNVQHRCRTIDYVEIGASSQLYFNCDSNTLNFYLVCFFDSNYNYISYYDLYNQTMPYQANVPSNAKYIRFSVAKRDNTNCSPSDFAGTNFYIGYINGNFTYKPSQSIPFIYQGNGALNAHDTMEIASSEYVITKNVVETDLGNYNYNGSNGVFNCDLGNIKTQTNDVVVNALCPLYVPVTRNDFVNNTPNMTMRVDNNQSTPYLYFRNTTYTSSAYFKTAMTGIKLRYELATPQVIRIPRKHLGIVDLGSLNWVYDGTNFKGTTIDGVYAGLDEIPNVYCERYIVDTTRELAYTHSKNMVISIYPANTILIRDTNYNDATTFKSAMSGTYLFYETANEVNDIATRIFTENGGTVTTNSEVLPNLDLDLPVNV